MPNNVSNVGFFGPQSLGAALAPDAYQKQLELSQRQALAQGMMAEGMQPMDPNRQAGGWTVPISPLEGLAHSGKTIAAALMQKNINKEQGDLAKQQQEGFMRMFGINAPQTNPMASGGGSVMSPDGGQAAKGAGGAPAGGFPILRGRTPQQTALQFMMSPESYWSAVNEQNKPQFINVRPGGTVYDPSANKPVFSAPQGNVQNQWTPNGPVQSVVPGAQQTQTQLSGTPLLNAPMQTIKLSNQRELQLTQPEYIQYTQSGGQVLPSRYQALSQEIPGMKFQDAQTAPQGQQGPSMQPPPPVPMGQAGGLQPIPGKVPPQDMPAFNAVASGSVPAAYGVGGQQATQKPPERAVVGATQSQGEQVQQARQTAGGKAVDEQFGKDYVAFTTGGAQDAAKQLSQLHDVVDQLQNPKANLTGPILGRTPDLVKSFTNPNSIAMRERVEEVVQRSLRAILGAQFTEKEGERLIARAYNPNLPESENAIRVNRLFTQLNQAFEAKQSAANYFAQNGTLDGWGGRIPSMSDFDPSPGIPGVNGSQASQSAGKVVNWNDLGR